MLPVIDKKSRNKLFLKIFRVDQFQQRFVGPGMGTEQSNGRDKAANYPEVLRI